MSAIALCLTLHIMWHMVVIRLLSLTSVAETMLDKLEKEYPDVFSEPTYPIWEYRQLF